MKSIETRLHDMWYDLAKYSEGRKHMNDFFDIVGKSMKDHEKDIIGDRDKTISDLNDELYVVKSKLMDALYS